MQPIPFEWRNRYLCEGDPTVQPAYCTLPYPARLFQTRLFSSFRLLVC